MLAIFVPASAVAQLAPSGVRLAYEASRDRFHYRFENASSFEGPELVPHEFTQTYVGDNQWLSLRASYRVGARPLQTEVAATPQRSTRGDDFDTFFQPSGDVVVSGTTGNVSMRSLRVRQRIGLGAAGGLVWHVAYQYRRDRMIFHPGAKTVNHTRPPSSETFTVYTRETTISETHDVRFGARRLWQVSSKWDVDWSLDIAPTTNARLTTRLPDKYPGRDIVFTAIAATINPTVTVTRRSRWPLSAVVGYTRTFSYGESRQFSRNALAAGVCVGW